MQSPTSAYWKEWHLLCDIAHRRESAKSMFGLEWLFAMMLCLLLLLMPAMFIREVSGRFGYLHRKIAVESWAVLKPIGLAVLLHYGVDAAIAPWIAILSLVDLFSYLLGLLFLARFYTRPASARRSLILVGVNFIELVLGFTIFYAHYGLVVTSNGSLERAPGALVFFSLVTAATVGYGDMVPVAGLGRAVVSVQIFASLVFLSVFISQAVGRVGGSDGGV